MPRLSSSASLDPAPGLRIGAGGTILIGGTPARMLRLSSKGAEAVAGWFAGKPVGPSNGHRQLGWRLVSSGLATLGLDRSPGPQPSSPVDIVIPVKDDLEGLVVTIRSVLPPTTIRSPTDNPAPTAERSPRRVIVVDDGSRVPITRSLLNRAGVDVDRSDVELVLVSVPRSGGPAAARNRGAKMATAPVIAFIDAGVTIAAPDLDRLVSETLEPSTVAAAPRVRPGLRDRTQRAGAPSSAGPQARLIADYEQRFSALDLGPRPGLAGSGRMIPYVPSTCLVVRSSTLQTVGGFDADLRYGEDVDLVWRLTEIGWVRYLPDITVDHPPRSSLGAFVAQRFHYGSSAGPLARRHGPAIAAARLSPGMAAFWMGVAAGAPSLSVIAAAWTTWRLRGTLSSHPTPTTEASALMATGIVQSGRGLSTAAARVWWPLYPLLVGVWPRAARVLLALMIAGWLRRLSPGSARSVLSDLALGALDDGAYGLGVWQGALANATATPLAPVVNGR